MSEMPDTFEGPDTLQDAVSPIGPPRTEHLARLVLVPGLPPLPSPRERVEDALGRELAGFLISALSGSHGRLGSSSP
jgi:hypothetical protein